MRRPLFVLLVCSSLTLAAASAASAAPTAKVRAQAVPDVPERTDYLTFAQGAKYTYSVIQRAVEERWPVVINDCSNEYKYYKLSRKHRGPGPFEGCLGYRGQRRRLHEIDRLNQRLGDRPEKPNP